MNRTSLCVAACSCMFVFAPGVYSQSSSRTPRTQTPATLEGDLEKRMANMRNLEGLAKQRSEKMREQEQEQALAAPPELDSRTKDRIRRLRKPDPADVQKYASLLGGDKSGLLKIFPNDGCVVANIVRVDERCAQFVPESSDFSFRSGVYTTPLYHDIGFTDGRFVSRAFFNSAVFVAIGDMSPEVVTLTTAGVDHLAELSPATGFKEARRAAAEYSRGVRERNMLFQSDVEPQVDTTYALRVIAYRVGNTLPPLGPGLSLTEMKFHSLSLDTRDDIIVVFKVIRKDEVGGLTIVWRELSRKQAPKLTFGKNDELADFR